MRHAKSGAWWEQNGQRALANNSACYTERPDVGVFMQEWLSLYESKSGERGIFNREAATNIVRKNGRRKDNYDFGTNPCSEIILRPYQFCNLSTNVVRANDTMETLSKKARLAAKLGTYQSTLTTFPYLRKIWQDNTEEERLLGVSLTGVLDSPLLNDPYDPELPNRLELLKQIVIDENISLAAIIGIPASTATTAIKPEGTTSQLTDSASGLHPRHSEFYIRRVRGDRKDPLTTFMINNGVPWEPDVTQPDSTVVFSFAKAAPVGALIRNNLTAIKHLKLWLIYQRHYCEHKPSITVSVSEKEWPSVGAFVWEYFDEMSGVSFLPEDGGTYRQAPYEECDEDTFLEISAKIPKYLDWDSLIEYEDNVEGTQILACSANGCELV
jgi:ribonucleoside-diphosphate reductase alpha chain